MLRRARLVTCWFVTLLALPACSATGTSDLIATGDDGGGAGDDGATATDDSAPANGATDSGTGATTDTGGTNTGSSGVSVIVEPNGNRGAELVDAIQAARTSVHVTMYLLSSSEVINALIAAHGAGVDVKVILNQTFPSSGTNNSSSYSQLQGAGIPVVWASSSFTYTHEKCAIIDGATAWIMTMNATYSAPIDNREYLAVDTTPADVAEAEQIFAADFAQTAISPSGPLVVAPVNAKPDIVAVIDGAQHTLDMEAEEFSDIDVTHAVAQAAQRGVAVRLVMANDSGNTIGSNSSLGTVKSAGARVYSSGGTAGSSTASAPYIHAKVAVADGARCYLGSENFTTGSLKYNRELGVVLTNASEIAKITSTINADVAKGTAL